MAEDLEKPLADLTKQLEELRLAFDLYFQGMERMPPTDQRAKWAATARRFKEETRLVKNTGVKFRMNNLWARYQTLDTLWSRILREIEEGTYKRDKFKVQLRNRARGAPNANGAAGGTEDGFDIDDLDFEEDADALMAEAEAAVAAPRRPAAAAPSPAAAAAAAPTPFVGTPSITGAGLRAGPPVAGTPAISSAAAAFAQKHGLAAPAPAVPRGVPGAVPVAAAPVRPAAPAASPAARPGAPVPPPLGAVPSRPAAAHAPLAAAAPSRPAAAPAPAPLGAVPSRPAAAPVAAVPPRPAGVPPSAAPGAVPARPAAAPPPRPAAPPPAAPAARPAAAASGGGDVNDDYVRRIERTLSETRKRIGDGTETNFDNLKAQLAKQVPLIKQQHGAKSVDFQVVVKDGKAVLKAIPKK